MTICYDSNLGEYYMIGNSIYFDKQLAEQAAAELYDNLSDMDD